MIGDQKSVQQGRRVATTTLLFAGGLALLVYTAQHLDLDLADLRQGFARIGGWFLAIMALSLGRFILRSYAWVTLMPSPVPLGAAVAATISGDALGNLTPLGLAASEPAKALYLRRHGSPAALLAALTAENFFYSVSVAVYVIVGAGAMLEFFPQLPSAVRIAGIASVISMAAVLAAAAWLAWQKPAIASNLIARVPVRRVRAWVDHVHAFETHTYGAAGHQGSRLAVVTACELAFHALSFVECWLTFWLLTGVSALLPALVFDAFNRVVNIVFKAVPLRVGVEEGGTGFLASAIGYVGADGIVLGLVRKVRVIVWAAVGMALWAKASIGSEK